MSIILARPGQLPLAGIVAPTQLSSVRPYHKMHYTDDTGLVPIVVRLDRPASGGETVSFVNSGSAVVDTHYTVATASPLTFSAGETEKTIEISLIGQGKFYEYVELTTTLSASSGVRLDAWASSILTVIRPAVRPPSVSFDLASSGASPGGAFSIDVTLDKVSGEDVTLIYELGGTVDLGDVTIPASGTVTIAAGSTTGSIDGSFALSASAGETLTVLLLHEDGTIVRDLSVRSYPTTTLWHEFTAEENVVAFSDPTNFEIQENVQLAQTAVKPGTPSNWGPGGTVVSGPPGVHAANFVPQLDPSPTLNPFTGDPLPIYAFSSYIVNGTPYLRESFADTYCDGPGRFGNPPIAEGYIEKSNHGMNVGEVVGYSAGRIFLDQVKNSSEWLTKTTGSFGFGTATDPTLDAQGWPVPVASTDYMLKINWKGGDNCMPAGDYEVTWEGTGTVLFGQDLTNDTGFMVTATSDITSNSKTITVDPTAGDGVYLRITGSDSGDPVRNVKVMYPGYSADTYEVFTPEFLAYVRRFDTLRMMDWQGTNFSPIVNFSDITSVDHYSYAVSTGVPIEIICRAASEAEANLWLCVPHQATDTCVTQWAQTVRACLAPMCRVFLEYTNEYWNQVFSTFGDPSNPIGQWDHCLIEANVRGLTGDDNTKRAKFHGQRSLEVWNLCDAVWRVEGSAVRRTRVLSGFIGTSFNHTTGLAEAGVQAKCDLVAIAPYIGHNTANDASFETDSDAATEGKLDADLTAMFAVSGPVDDAIQSLSGLQNDELRDIKLAFYECGQDLTPVMNAFGGSWTDDDTVRDKAIRINRSAYMGDWYTDLQSAIQTLLDSGDLALSCFYESVSRYVDSATEASASLYVGQFGLCEYSGQLDSPKLNSVLAQANNTTSIWNPSPYGSLAAYNRISFYLAKPHGEDAYRAEHANYAQIVLRNRSKSINHTVTFKLNYPSLVGQVDRNGDPVTPVATSIGNVGYWFSENESGVTPMEFGVVEDEFGVRVWMLHHADDVTLYPATYANIGDVDDDGSGDASGNWPDMVGKDSANAIVRPTWTDDDVILEAGGIQEMVGQGYMIYGIMHERSNSSLSGPPGRYRRKPRHWHEPEGFAYRVPGSDLHTITLS